MKYNKPREISSRQFFWKIDPSNLSVDKKYSMVTLSVFVSVSNELQPYKRVCVK